jgi:hypothetical protein
LMLGLGQDAASHLQDLGGDLRISTIASSMAPLSIRASVP